MVRPLAWLIFLFLAAGSALALDDCSLNGSDLARKAFAKQYKAKQYKDAFEALSHYQQACLGAWSTKHQPEFHDAKLGIVSDLALGAHRLDKDALCREIIEKAIDEPSKETSRNLKNLEFNYKLCGCATSKSPNPILCEQKTWEQKKGFLQLVRAIHSKLPPFLFQYYPEKRLLKYRPLRAQSPMQQIVFQANDGLSDDLLRENASPPDFEDMDFDGYQDLVGTPAEYCGNGGCCTSPRYLFAPKLEKFVKNDELSELCYAGFDGTRKQVTSSYRASCCEHGNDTYEWKDGTLAQVQSENDKYDVYGGCTYNVVTTQALRGSEMETVSKSIRAHSDECPAWPQTSSHRGRNPLGETWANSLQGLKSQSCKRLKPNEQVLYADIDGDGKGEEIVQSSSCLTAPAPVDVFAVYRITPERERVRVAIVEKSPKKIQSTTVSPQLDFDGKHLIESFPLSKEKSLRFLYRWEKDHLVMEN